MGAPGTAAELLARMVSFDTVNPLFGGKPGGEAALATWLEETARGWGLGVERLPVSPGGPWNLLVTCEAVPGAEWLLFESHLDTVAVEGMTVDPFAGRIDGGRLHGRGACDTKGTGAAALWALRQYASSPRRPRNVGLLFVADEEVRMTGARAFAAGALARYLPSLRGVVVGEPTSLRPVVAHNGVVRWKTITRGVAAHSANPSRGRSAIAAMMKVVSALEERFVPLAARTHPLTGRAAASINTIRGGSAINIIPDRCEIECDRRMAPGETPESVLAERDAALAGLEVEHAELYAVPAFGGETGRAFHAWMSPVLSRHGLDPSPRGEPYVTDASHYAARGAPCVVLGPGGFAQAHTKDEWISLAELDLGAQVYGDLMAIG
jgi:acetylornithine deacetylase